MVAAAHAGDPACAGSSCDTLDSQVLLQAKFQVEKESANFDRGPGMSADEIRGKLSQKQGMNANSKVGRDTLNQFTSTSSWFWTYALEPNSKALAWAQDTGKEFVPLVSLKRVLPRKYGKCSFEDGTCTVYMLVNVLEKTKKSVTTRYLMGYNEPYANHQQASSYGNKGSKGVNGTEGAHWWRLWIQPAAERTGLELVSPTTGISSQKSGWMIEFLQACYDNRNAVPPCNVEKIKAFSLHEYKCYASFWRKYAAKDGGDDVSVVDKSCSEPFKPKKETNFYTQMKMAMRKRYGDEPATSFWDPYFDNVKLWVTETSCSGDLYWDKLNNHKARETPTAEQSCERITGQSCQHKEGSVNALLSMDNIERFSWFTLFPNPPKNHPNFESITAAAIMDSVTGAARPVGRALLNALDPVTAKCNGGTSGLDETLKQKTTVHSA